MSKTFYADGTSGNIAIGDTSTITSAITDPSSYLPNLTFHSALNYLQLRSAVTAGSVSFDGFAQDYIYWDDGGCDCFTSESLVTLADGSKKPIVNVNIGDKVLGMHGTINTVTFIEKVPDTLWKYLYSPDPNIKPFVTVNHPLYINNKLVAIDPVAVWDLYPWLGKPEPLLEYYLKPASGVFVYNLWLTGDGTYIVNGYNTTSIMFSGDFLSYSFGMGWLSQQEVLDLLNFYTSKGKHVQYGAYLVNKGLSYIKSKSLLKFIAKQLKREKSVVKIFIVLFSKILGTLLHPNR